MTKLISILRRLNKASHQVAINHEIKRYPIAEFNERMSDPELMELIRTQINFLESPHFAYLMYNVRPEPKNVPVSSGQPSCGPGLHHLKN